MIKLDEIENFYMYQGPTDLRKGIDGYCALVSSEMDLDAFSNSLFLFCNRKKDKLKILYWDGNGFWLLYKRLEAGKFRWLNSVEETSYSLSHQQMRWLLEGLDIHQKRAFREMKNRVI